MKEVAQGIYTKFTSVDGGGLHNDLYLSVSGRMYPYEAPQDVVFPYIVYSFPTVRPEFTFTNQFEEARVQFSIFSKQNSSLEVEGIRQKLWVLYDKCDLSLTGYSSVSMRRIMTVLKRDDRPAWNGITDYYVFVEKT